MKSGPVTVVIPTHDRYGKLGTLLESIEKCQPHEIESVIVVDDSEKPVRIASSFRSLNLKHIVLKDRAFISRAKNIGWRDATTEFAFFIDDDNVVDEETIPRVYQTISRMPKVGAIMPAVLYKSKPSLVWVYAAQFLKSGPRFNLIGRNLRRNASLENRLLLTDALPNASMIRRKALEDVGGFDERLVVNSSMDLSLRLKSKGWQVLSFTGSFIYHDVEPPGKMGWWATHGAADPERVRFEIRDWFIIMHLLHGKKRLFMLRAVMESSRFIIPNLLAYLLRSKSRRQLVLSLAKGYIEGIRITC
ncbi:MAG: glycosyltransferase [Candidatus Bathyarchaeia archaeon]|jgi:GT2 family glycosyltransferase